MFAKTELDDLTSLKPFSEAIQKLEDLVSQSGRVFLMGAGCSVCAGLPLTNELTKRVLTSEILDSSSKKILQAIEGFFKGDECLANIEDFLSELIDLLAIASRRSNRGSDEKKIFILDTPYEESELIAAITQIKSAIANIINIQVSIDIHKRFVTALHRPVRPGKSSPNQAIDYLVLNYDTLLEDALAFEKISYSDGMDGGITAWWNPILLDNKDLNARVLKLHGSIDWKQLEEDPLPRRISANISLLESGEEKKGQNILIWPASTKYKETQLDPYAQLLSKARIALNPDQHIQRVLVICGYSFCDEHINIEIERALHESNGNLTVVAFTEHDKPTGKLNVWNKDNRISNQLLIFAKKGFFHGEIKQKSDSPLLWWKFENITRILEGER